MYHIANKKESEMGLACKYMYTKHSYTHVQFM